MMRPRAIQNDKEMNMSVQTDKSIHDYLAAIGQVYGADYRDRMVVAFCGGHYYRVKHPGGVEGQLVPVGHLDLMTAHLLRQSGRR